MNRKEKRILYKTIEENNYLGHLNHGHCTLLACESNEERGEMIYVVEKVYGCDYRLSITNR